MKKFVISITETLNRCYTINAETSEEAINRVQKLYSDCQVVLDADDFVDYEIIDVTEENKEIITL